MTGDVAARLAPLRASAAEKAALLADALGETGPSPRGLAAAIRAFERDHGAEAVSAAADALLERFRADRVR